MNAGGCDMIAWSTCIRDSDGKALRICKTCYKPADRKPIGCSEQRHSQHYESRRKASNRYYHSHRKKVAEYMKKYRKDNREAVRWVLRRGHLRRKYGLTLQQIDAMLKEQDFRCNLCKEPFRSTPFVDHDHKSGRIRGLLCRLCNTSIWHVERFPLQTLKEYLGSP
jgi:hypothetical protein